MVRARIVAGKQIVAGGAVAVALSVLLAVMLAGCSTGSVPSAPASPTTTTVTTTPVSPTTVASSGNGQGSIGYDTNAAVSYAVGAQPTNWDIHSAGASPWYLTLEQVLAQVWPSPFYVTTNGTPTLDTSLLTSAAEVSTGPETIVYQINPLAVWSNGVPITYRDFLYNWEAQSGQVAFQDAGGTRYTPLDEAGYDDISSVTGTAANPRTVRVTFSSPYPDWQSLFSYLMPAQVGRVVGFDSGFKDPVADLVSGGPFLVSELQAGYSLELVRNARYWGDPANVSGITYYFTSGAAEVENALNAGEIDLATVQAGPSVFKQLQADPGLSVRAVASSFYEDLDMNEASGPLASPVLRRAITMALDRDSMATQLLSPYGLAAAPVEDRVFLPGNPGYSDDGAGYDKPAPAAAMHLLTANGYSLSGGVLHGPGTQNPGGQNPGGQNPGGQNPGGTNPGGQNPGRPVSLSLVVEATDPIAQQLAEEVATACAAIGISVSTVQSGSSSGDMLEAATAPPLPAGWQLAIELRQVPAFPSEVAGRYAAGGRFNQDGYASATMNALLAEAHAAVPAQYASVFHQVDQLAWKNYVDVPLVQVPVVVAVNSKLLNVNVGPFLGYVAWNEEDWGFRAS